MESILGWAGAFALTQAIEMPLYARALPGPRRWLKAFGASAITHPVLWWVVPRVVPWGWLSLAVAEVAIVLVEAAYLALLRARRPLLGSLVANVASCVAGLAIYALLDRR